MPPSQGDTMLRAKAKELDMLKTLVLVAAAELQQQYSNVPANADSCASCTRYSALLAWERFCKMPYPTTNDDGFVESLKAKVTEHLRKRNNSSQVNWPATTLQESFYKFARGSVTQEELVQDCEPTLKCIVDTMHSPLYLRRKMDKSDAVKFSVEATKLALAVGGFALSMVLILVPEPVVTTAAGGVTAATSAALAASAMKEMLEFGKASSEVLKTGLESAEAAYNAAQSTQASQESFLLLAMGLEQAAVFLLKQIEQGQCMAIVEAFHRPEHIMDRIAFYCQRVGLLDEDNRLLVNSPEELLRKNPFHGSKFMKNCGQKYQTAAAIFLLRFLSYYQLLLATQQPSSPGSFSRPSSRLSWLASSTNSSATSLSRPSFTNTSFSRPSTTSTTRLQCGYPAEPTTPEAAACPPPMYSPDVAHPSSAYPASPSHSAYSLPFTSNAFVNAPDAYGSASAAHSHPFTSLSFSSAPPAAAYSQPFTSHSFTNAPGANGAVPTSGLSYHTPGWYDSPLQLSMPSQGMYSTQQPSFAWPSCGIHGAPAPSGMYDTPAPAAAPHQGMYSNTPLPLYMPPSV